MLASSCLDGGPVIYWFRQDLRLHDNAGLLAACAAGSMLLPVYCHPPDVETRWGFARTGPHRQHFLNTTLHELRKALAARGSALLELQGRPEQLLPILMQSCRASALFCERIAAPEEEVEVSVLHAAGVTVNSFWQSSLFDVQDLPFPCSQLPAVFSTFRRELERSHILPPAPLPAPEHIPPVPPVPSTGWPGELVSGMAVPLLTAHAASAFPYQDADCSGGEQAALAHWQDYLARGLPHTYKATRNGLSARDDSTKLSPWLALGALSPRRVYADLKRFEDERGASDSSYWIVFELLWRDYFRFLHLQHGASLYRPTGLSAQAWKPVVDEGAFKRWCIGSTGHYLIDAGMRELVHTGYLSNRMRQIVASYLIYDLKGDWRAGAAWFESQLIDYDVYSNQGNWLYIAGRGTDPRGGRRFNSEKQAREHDPDGDYGRRWGTL